VSITSIAISIWIQWLVPFVLLAISAPSPSVSGLLGWFICNFFTIIYTIAISIWTQ
jgi:hypothetical protein